MILIKSWQHCLQSLLPFIQVLCLFRQVLIFNEKNVVDCFQAADVVSAMKFGRFGREDCALVLIGNGGGLMVKILKRTAQFETLESALVPQLSKVWTRLYLKLD